jgi:aspartyl protease family protein
MKKQMLRLMAVLLSGLCAQLSLAETQVNIVGLYSNKAVLIINNGKPKTLSVGQISEGVKLLAANSLTATLQIEGKARQLGMGQAATVSGMAASGVPTAILYADPAGHFVSDCQINGATLKFVVDTGATSVALNSGDAKYANIDYRRGQLVRVDTANGVTNAYRVMIATLKIGSITLNQVEGVVLEGGSPSVVLLGMTALNRLDMKRQDIALTLTKKY